MPHGAVLRLAQALKSLAARVAHLERNERSEVTGAVQTYTFANLPVTGVGDGSLAMCTDCRKDGEGGGAGTGTPVYRDGGTWRNFSDDAAAAI